MRKLHLSPAAAEDIENILRYTFDTWGEKQFELYHTILQQTFNSILADPEGPFSKSRDELFPSSRSIRAGHQVVFFRLRKKNIEIIRIFHEKMDFLRHMDEEE